MGSARAFGSPPGALQQPPLCRAPGFVGELLAEQNDEWAVCRRCKEKSGRPDDDQLVFPTRDRRVWTESHWRNWRRRIFEPAASSAGLDDFRPYDLRRSFVSLLFAEGRRVIVARQAGHSPTMALATYGHVIEELEGAGAAACPGSDPGGALLGDVG